RTGERGRSGRRASLRGDAERRREEDLAVLGLDQGQIVGQVLRDPIGGRGTRGLRLLLRIPGAPGEDRPPARAHGVRTETRKRLEDRQDAVLRLPPELMRVARIAVTHYAAVHLASLSEPPLSSRPTREDASARPGPLHILDRLSRVQPEKTRLR